MVNRTFPSRLWQYPSVRRLSRDAKLLFVYLFTCSESHPSGLYHMPAASIAHFFKVTEGEAMDWLSELSEHVDYDTETEFVFVREMLFEQRGLLSPNIVKAIETELRNLPPTSLLKRFVERYTEFKHTLSKGFQKGSDTVSKPYRNPPISNSRSFSKSNSVSTSNSQSTSKSVSKSKSHLVDSQLVVEERNGGRIDNNQRIKLIGELRRHDKTVKDLQHHLENTYGVSKTSEIQPEHFNDVLDWVQGVVNVDPS